MRISSRVPSDHRAGSEVGIEGIRRSGHREEYEEAAVGLARENLVAVGGIRIFDVGNQLLLAPQRLVPLKGQRRRLRARNLFHVVHEIKCRTWCEDGP